MRRFLNITTLIILYLLFTAKSCDNQEQDSESRVQARVKIVRDSIKSTFRSDSLSDASLRAFESTAKIMLSDFNDYLAILQDTSVAGPFRDKAREMILGLFNSENSMIRVRDPDEPGWQEVPVKQVLKRGNASMVPFGKVITDSVRVEENLRRTDDSSYAGKLSYKYIPVRNGQAQKQNLVNTSGTFEIILKHHEKIFGTDTLMVWEIFLGNPE